MSTLHKNPEYSLRREVDWTKPVFRFTENGTTDRNPRWNGNLVELLTTLIADVNQPASERDRAAECLKYYLEKEKEFREKEKQAGREPNDTLIGMLVYGIAYAERLWEYPERFVIQEIVNDGVVRRCVVRLEEPAPIPTQQNASS